MIADDMVARITAHRQAPGHPDACPTCTRYLDTLMAKAKSGTEYRHIVSFVAPLPPWPLSPNERPHWAKRNKAAQVYKSDVYLACLEALGRRRPLVPKARICLIFRTGGIRYEMYNPKDERRGVFKPAAPDDVDNAVAAFKAGFDGIRDTGIFPDDDHRHLELGTVEIRREGPPGVDVMILEVLTCG